MIQNTNELIQKLAFFEYVPTSHNNHNPQNNINSPQNSHNNQRNQNNNYQNRYTGRNFNNHQQSPQSSNIPPLLPNESQGNETRPSH